MAEKPVVSHKNPLDIESENFDCDAFLAKTLRENRLETLLDKELALCKDTRALECEMEQLVYENYNKFITATDTIRKMQTDFVNIEQEMDKLAANMQKISALSDRLGGSLSTKRDNVNKLARANKTLKNLQFLFDLPATLQLHYDSGDYQACAKSYSKMVNALDTYKAAPALEGIRKECEEIVDKLRTALYNQLSSSQEGGPNESTITDFEVEGSSAALTLSTKSIVQAVESLFVLGESSEKLSTAFIERASMQMKLQMDELYEEIELKRKYNDKLKDSTYNIDNESDIIKIPVDVLEFVDNNVSALLGNLSLLCTSYSQLFLNDNQLDLFVDDTLQCLIQVCEKRFSLDIDVKDSAMLVRSIDKFYRRLAVNSKLLPSNAANNAQTATVELLLHVAYAQIDQSLDYLCKQSCSAVNLARTQIVQQPHKSLSSEKNLTAGQKDSYLVHILTLLEDAIVHECKSMLASLLQYITCDCTFAQQEQHRFVKPFSAAVRRNILAKFTKKLSDIFLDYATGSGDKSFINATLLLLLSKFAQNLENGTLARLIDLCEQQFGLTQLRHTLPEEELSASLSRLMGASAQHMIDRYVELEAFALSQLLVKSIETRDWLSTAEPRQVRAVIKRVLEDIAAIDVRVSQLYDDRKNSSRHSGTTVSNRRSSNIRTGRTSTPLSSHRGGNNMLLDNALGKLWSEKVEYFTSVQLCRGRILHGIVKICLKTLVESARLITFGEHGFQQMQVDCHYLITHVQHYATNDEDAQVIQYLIDEIVASTELRCCVANAHRMPQSVIDAICLRG